MLLLLKLGAVLHAQLSHEISLIITVNLRVESRQEGLQLLYI